MRKKPLQALPAAHPSDLSVHLLIPINGVHFIQKGSKRPVIERPFPSSNEIGWLQAAAPSRVRPLSVDSSNYNWTLTLASNACETNNLLIFGN